MKRVIKDSTKRDTVWLNYLILKLIVHVFEQFHALDNLQRVTTSHYSKSCWKLQERVQSPFLPATLESDRRLQFAGSTVVLVEGTANSWCIGDC